MQMVVGGAPGVPDTGDDLAGTHLGADLHGEG